MTSLRSIINRCEILENGKKPEIYTSCKDLSKYIKGGISSLSVEELKNTAKALNKYTKNIQIASNEYMFGNVNIKLDDEQHRVVKTNIDRNIRRFLSIRINVISDSLLKIIVQAIKECLQKTALRMRLVN